MRPSRQTLFLTLACAAVGAAVIAGVWAVGGPGAARLRKFDAARLQNLQRLSAEVDGYYSANGALPDNLTELAARQGDLTASALQDPETNAAYGYSRKGERAYQLCASFHRPSEPETPIRWRHARGYACFDLTAPQDLRKSPEPGPMQPQ